MTARGMTCLLRGHHNRKAQVLSVMQTIAEYVNLTWVVCSGLVPGGLTCQSEAKGSPDPPNPSIASGYVAPSRCSGPWRRPPRSPSAISWRSWRTTLLLYPTSPTGRSTRDCESWESRRRTTVASGFGPLTMRKTLPVHRRRRRGRLSMLRLRRRHSGEVVPALDAREHSEGDGVVADTAVEEMRSTAGRGDACGRYGD